MVVILEEGDLPRAREIFLSYGKQLTYSKVFHRGKTYYAVSEGPVGALLQIRASLADTANQRIFGLF